MAEIKISELSIGDWVRYRDREWQVCSLYQFTEEVGLWRKDSQLCEYVADIEPIPLTPEILEKNGWSRKNDYGGWYLFYDKDIRVNIWFDKCRWDIEISSEDGKVTYADITGRGTLHTHQLQHALRLAGVGNDIEL